MDDTNVKLMLRLLDEVQTGLDEGFANLTCEVKNLANENSKQSTRIEKLENLTRVNTFISKNPVKSMIIGMVVFYGMGWLFENIPLLELIKLIK